MRKFRIKEDVDTRGLVGHESGGVYELEEIDDDGGYWLKASNKYKCWCYDPEEIEEVFEHEEQKPTLHKDTDLGYFACLLLANKNETIDSAIWKAKELILQLDIERKF